MFFKSFVSKNQFKNGDDIWISVCGNICVIIDAVSISKNPSITKHIIIEFLNEGESELLHLSSEEITRKMNTYLVLKDDDILASVCILKKVDNTINYCSVGNSQILKITSSQTNFILETMNQPNSVLGMKDIIINSDSFLIDNDAMYILSTDGLNFNNLRLNDVLINLRNYNDWYSFADDIKKENDWSFSVFPFEKTLSYENYEWPYFPFVGPQEEYEHEKDGLAKIANELFLDPDFNGFKILGGAEIAVKNSFRKLDGILISPFGVVLLELKDWYGDIEVPIEGRGRQMRANFEGNIHTDTSPIVKINEAMDDFTSWSILKDIELQEKRIGSIIFTHKNSKIRCIDGLGNELEGVYKSGNILVSNVEDFPKFLKQYWKYDISKGKKYRLSIEQIESICDSYLSNESSESSDISNMTIKNGKYSFNPKNKDENLSTEYYTLYRGLDTRKNKPVWIKEYELTTISKGSLEEEANRIKREADALQDLNKSPNVQDFKDEDQIGTKLYIVLEYIDGLTLQDFLLTTSINHSQKLQIIYELALTLKELEVELIIHRALNPKNIIINSNNKPILINFELCKLDFLPTLPPRGRRLLDSAYEAREVNANASSDISIAADIYSLGQIICEMLRGSLFFSNQKERMLIAKKDKNWHITLCKECNLPDIAANHLKSILSNDPSSRPTVDELLVYIKSWMGEEN